METKKFYKFSTAAGMLHAEVIPTMQALGDQPWAVRVRDTKGVLLLSFTTEEMSGREAATEAVRLFLDCKRDIHNKTFSIQ